MRLDGPSGYGREVDVERLWRWETGLAILIVFWLAAIVYWVWSGALDPAGATMLLFAGGAMGFGFAILFRGAQDL